MIAVYSTSVSLYFCSASETLVIKSSPPHIVQLSSDYYSMSDPNVADRTTRLSVLHYDPDSGTADVENQVRA